MKRYLIYFLFSIFGSVATLTGAHFYLADLLAPASIFDIRTAKKGCEAFAESIKQGTCALTGGFILRLPVPPPVRSEEDAI